MKNKFISLSTALAIFTMGVGLPLTAPSASAKQSANKSKIVPTITSVNVVNSQVLVSGTATAVIKGRSITVPFSGVAIDLSVSNDQGGSACPSVDLRLAPINVNVLGLMIQTGPLCLTVTPPPGGNALGDALCTVSKLLNAGLTPDQILAGTGTGTVPGLTMTQITNLRTGLMGLFNGALANLGQAVLTSITPVSTRNACAILRFEIAPSNLTLLGMSAALGNCTGGAVTVEITSVTGLTNIVGNLLCQYVSANLLYPGQTLQDIVNQIFGMRR